MIWDWFRRRRGDPSWLRCPHCAENQAKEAVERLDLVCPSCGHHHPLPLAARLALLCDEGAFEEQDLELATGDYLSWKAAQRYRESLAAARKECGLHAGNLKDGDHNRSAER